MVEIIYRGTKPGLREYTTKCPACRTEFRFKTDEAEHYNDRDGTGFKIDCPVCRRKVWKNLP